MTVPTLRTQRLVLRSPELRDARVLAKVLNNIEISRWLVFVPFPYGITDAQRFINESLRGNLNAWFIWAGGDFLGTISLSNEFGYWLAPHAWGQGYATEAGHAVLDHHFTTTNADIIKSSHLVENRASQNVLTKLGFLDVGMHVHLSATRQADVAVRSVQLTRERWHCRNDG